ncbi:MAG TPA: hypothetical protein ENN81_11295 [Phycisphaerales bacterium]|mgnify:CR=1 FL=1|nr:hypothetical protein [Phycisphaerales bacterium]
MKNNVRPSPPLARVLRQALYYKGVALGTLGFCTRWAVNVHGHGPEWIEVVNVDLPLSAVQHRFGGMRIAHISDLHCSRLVSTAYLRRCIDRVNMLESDLVLLTGDFITYDFQGDFRSRVADMLSRLRSRHGAYACLGNHDYGLYALRHVFKQRREAALSRFMDDLQDNGVTVLRNRAVSLDIDGHPLWIVGLGDIKLNDFDPHTAFSGVRADELTLVLLHNPRGVARLSMFPAHAVLSGHTHGRRAASPYIAPLITKNRTYHAGMHDVGASKLYVNRGLGRHGRTRFNARPEITVYTIQ